MLRSFLFAASLIALLPASGRTSVAASSTPSTKAVEPLNIGFALYAMSDVPGTLNARWSYSNAYTGPGVATGGPRTGGFAGHYHIRYFLENGAFSDEYDLDIVKHTPGNFYDVTWLTKGKVRARGVGMEVADGKSLAVGWRRVAD